VRSCCSAGCSTLGAHPRAQNRCASRVVPNALTYLESTVMRPELIEHWQGCWPTSPPKRSRHGRRRSARRRDVTSRTALNPPASIIARRRRRRRRRRASRRSGRLSGPPVLCGDVFEVLVRSLARFKRDEHPDIAGWIEFLRPLFTQLTSAARISVVVLCMPSPPSPTRRTRTLVAVLSKFPCTRRCGHRPLITRQHNTTHRVNAGREHPRIQTGTRHRSSLPSRGRAGRT